MSKNLKTLICCILSLLFVSGTVIAVFADSNDLFAKEPEAVSATEVVSEVESEVETDVEADEEVSYRLGDVNFDGAINAADARLTLRISAQLDVPTAEEFVAANVILDGAITAADARLILRKAARLD